MMSLLAETYHTGGTGSGAGGLWHDARGRIALIVSDGASLSNHRQPDAPLIPESYSEAIEGTGDSLPLEGFWPAYLGKPRRPAPLEHAKSSTNPIAHRSRGRAVRRGICAGNKRNRRLARTMAHVSRPRLPTPSTG
jgi:hypothetical protein